MSTGQPVSYVIERSDGKRFNIPVDSRKPLIRFNSDGPEAVVDDGFVWVPYEANLNKFLVIPSDGTYEFYFKDGNTFVNGTPGSYTINTPTMRFTLSDPLPEVNGVVEFYRGQFLVRATVANPNFGVYDLTITHVRM